MAATSVQVIDPRFMGVRQWTAQTSLNLWAYGPIPKLTDEGGWPGWASYVVSLPGIAAYGAPRPERFERWEDWAVRFNLVLQLVGT